MSSLTKARHAASMRYWRKLLLENCIKWLVLTNNQTTSCWTYWTWNSMGNLNCWTALRISLWMESYVAKMFWSRFWPCNLTRVMHLSTFTMNHKYWSLLYLPKDVYSVEPCLLLMVKILSKKRLLQPIQWMLSALALTLGATPQVSIDPRYASKLSPHDCQLFLTSVAVAKFNKIVSSETDLLHTSTTSMSQLRQHTTSFHHPSNFSCWSRSFKPFCDILHIPATIFTLCGLPSFSGYGSNSTSVAILSSQLLAVWTCAYFYHNSMLTEDQMATFMILCD